MDTPPTPIGLAVDLVALTVLDDALNVLTVTRGIPPFEGRMALPGGFVHADEDLADAAVRELAEETGISSVPGHLEQLATYGAPGRDPRMRVVSVAWLVLGPDLGLPEAGSDAAGAAWTPVASIGPGDLAFDHGQILADGVERARSKLEYTALATAFCDQEFTMTDLRHVYEVVWDTELDPRNFHRKVTSTPGFVVDTGGTAQGGPGRPATLYRSGDLELLHPPLLRDR